MEFASALASLQAECCCAVCLDYFKDPVTIDCGHNFCCDCLCACWDDLADADAFPCPVCRFPFASRRFHRNPQLRSLTETAQQLGARRSKRKRQPEPALCEQHQQARTLFCATDLELLCSRCSFAPKHREHHVCPIEEAGRQQRLLLEGSVQQLRNSVEQVEMMIALQGSKTQELRKAAEARREEIADEFEQVRQFLQGEREAVLRQIREEEAEILAEVNQNLGSFYRHASDLKRLLREVEAKSAGSDVAVLTSLKSIVDESRELGQPEDCAVQLSGAIELSGYELRLPAQYSGLERIVRHFQIDMLFDPTTAHPQLVVSRDKKSVRYDINKRRVCYAPRRFYLCTALLGCQKFDCGRHYWEVEVSTKPKWTLGACQGCLPRNWRNEPAVSRGFWALGRCGDRTYHVFGAHKAQIVPNVRPSRVGVFLDYELGEISFYNVDDGSVLYTFRDRFTQTIWPYFYAGRDSKPLRLSSGSDPET